MQNQIKSWILIIILFATTESMTSYSFKLSVEKTSLFFFEFSKNVPNYYIYWIRVVLYVGYDNYQTKYLYGKEYSVYIVPNNGWATMHIAVTLHVLVKYAVFTSVEINKDKICHVNGQTNFISNVVIPHVKNWFS